MSQLLKTKSIESLIHESECGDKRLKRSLGPWSLICFGVGAVIGSGIFSLTGTAAVGSQYITHSIFEAPVLDLLLHGSTVASNVGRPGAGPGITLSFILVAIVCGFAALCYAELASMIPIAGSAYTYAYTTLGEIFAWIIGWDLILEYAVGAATVGNGWSSYFQRILGKFQITLPDAIGKAPLAYDDGAFTLTNGVINLPAVLIV